jgi:hypothetical protein
MDPLKTKRVFAVNNDTLTFSKGGLTTVLAVVVATVSFVGNAAQAVYNNQQVVEQLRQLNSCVETLIEKQHAIELRLGQAEARLEKDMKAHK